MILIALMASMSLAAAPAPKKPPKLVVTIVIDQLGATTLTAMEPRLSPDGFIKILSNGTRFTNANYEQLATYTGPGHATIATGAYPHLNGVTSNKYFDREAKKSFTALFDAEAPLLDSPPDAEDDSSPRTLKMPTLGDVMKRKNPKTKVVSVALKDRASVLMGGHDGQAFWFSEATGKMTTSSYYAKAVPSWVTAFNTGHSVDAAFNTLWERSAPIETYTGPDDAPYEADFKGLGRTFPHRITGKVEKPGPDFYAAWEVTSLATAYELEFTKAAIEAEQLGADEVTDLLAVSFTPTDYAGHAFGPDSHEVQDAILAVDRAIAELLRFIDTKVGAQNVLVVLTADHGAAPAPEKATTAEKPARRVKKSELKAAINAALVAKFGEGEWVVALEDPSIYVNLALAAQKKIAPDELEKAALAAALQVKGIATGFTRTALLQGTSTEPWFHAAWLSFYPDKSGDLVLVPTEGSFWGKYGERSEGSTHGSPYSYDTHVPLAFYGPGVPKRTVDAAATPADIAPTLAKRLGLSLPGVDGHPRPEL